MSHICNCLKLPKMSKCRFLPCIRITMDNGEEYIIKNGDLVGIQFVKDDKRILLRRGRVKDIVVVNRRQISSMDDNVSRIILDCSEQFSIKIIEIHLKDIIKIGDIDDEFPDYSDRIKELESNYIQCDGCRIPTRQGGMITEEEMKAKLSKPGKNNVCKMSNTGEFDDLYDMNANRPYLEELRANSVITEEDIQAGPVEKSAETSPTKKTISRRGIPIMR